MIKNNYPSDIFVAIDYLSCKNVPSKNLFILSSNSVY